MNVDPLQVLSKLAAVYNIPACRVTPPFAGLENFDYGLRKALDPEFDWQEFGYTLLKHTPEQTLLIAEGTFELKFALFRVPDEKDTVLMIGPWTDGPRSEDSRRWAQKNLGKAGDEAVQEYYNGVHTLSGDDFATAILRRGVCYAGAGGTAHTGSEGVSALHVPAGYPLLHRTHL